jgi:nucleoside-diphosphate kinase
VANQRTLSIIKPDATAANNVGAIIARFEEEGLKIAAMRKIHMSVPEAQGFYAVHSERPFFNDLVAFMTEGPCVVMALEGEDAIVRNRQIMGATNPADAADGTLRKRFATNIERNAVHGSDSPENAAIELAYFFRTTELF